MAGWPTAALHSINPRLLLLHRSAFFFNTARFHCRHILPFPIPPSLGRAGYDGKDHRHLRPRTSRVKASSRELLHSKSHTRCRKRRACVQLPARSTMSKRTCKWRSAARSNIEAIMKRSALWPIWALQRGRCPWTPTSGRLPRSRLAVGLEGPTG